MARGAEAPVGGGHGLSAEALEALKLQIMTEIEARLHQKDESLWRRGQAEIRRLHSEQQQINSSISKLQESQAQLVVESQQIRSALLEVTCKFEIVVKEMREALRALPQRGDSQPSPTPSVASTSASELAGNSKHPAELTPGSAAGAELAASWSVEQSCWQSPCPVMPGWLLPDRPVPEALDIAGSMEVSKFCTPPRLAAGGGRASESSSATAPASSEVPPRGSGSPAVLSLESALPAAKAAPSGLKLLQLAECLQQEPAAPCAATTVEGAVAAALLEQPRPGTAGMPDVAASPAVPPLPCQPQAPTTPDGRKGARAVELVKEVGFVTLGMEVNADGPYLLVEGIDEHGLVGRHNLKQTSLESKVNVGDRIVEVNGAGGDPARMLQECKASQRIIFKISNSESDEQDAPAAGAASSEEQSETCPGSAKEPPSQLRREARVFVPLAHSEASPLAPAGGIAMPPGLQQAQPEQAWGLAAGLLEVSPHVLAKSMVELASTAPCEQSDIKRALFP